MQLYTKIYTNYCDGCGTSLGSTETELDHIMFCDDECFKLYEE